MASNTGWTSVGEAEMTRRISAVAVWRSSASFVSLKSRAFWIAITAWSANGLQQRDLLLGELADGIAADEDRADATTLP